MAPRWWPTSCARAGVEAEPFHGLLSQGKRTQVLADFKASRVQVVVATDLAARGIDVAQLPVVVNYDLPRSAVDYVHRIGRTGRAGESGVAVSFVSAATEAHFRLIEKRQGLNVPRERVAGFEPAEAPPPAPAGEPGTGGIKGKRPSKKDKLRAFRPPTGRARANGRYPRRPPPGSPRWSARSRASRSSTRRGDRQRRGLFRPRARAGKALYTIRL